MKSIQLPRISRLWSMAHHDYAVANSEGVLGNKDRVISIAKLNLLIGPNNSGKSRFARKLYETEYSNILIHDEDFYKLLTLENLSPLNSLLEALQSDPTIPINEIRQVRKGAILPITTFNKISGSLLDFLDRVVEKGSYNNKAGNVKLVNLVREIFNNAERTESIKQTLENRREYPTRYYIPVLRGLRKLGNEDLYAARTRTDYFPSGPDTVYQTIKTGFNLYELLTDHLLGKPDDRQKIRELENILGQEFFEGQPITLIPERKSDTVAMQIGSEPQFPIFDLGDGLQQLLIMASATFLEPKPSIFIIEEPEMAMHPGLLRQLAFFFLNHTNHQYFITTQNTFLVDIAEYDNRVSLCRFKKQKDEKRPFLISQDLVSREILLDLGIHPSSVYLANCTIWVEGTTDTRYIRCYLEKYKEQNSELKKYLENLHYTFVEYQGGNLPHWSFADASPSEELTNGLLSAVKACASAFLIADGDIKNKGNRVEQLQSELGKRLHILNCKEIENLLPVQAVCSVVQDLYDARKPMNQVFGSLIDVKTALESLTLAHYSSSPKGLGHILDNYLKKHRKITTTLKPAESFAEKSGTIKDKVKFCNKAIAAIKKIDNWSLTQEQKDLCEKIFAHVREHNPDKI